MSTSADVAAAPGRAGRPPAITALTGLRFAAAAIVMVEHFPRLFPGLDPLAASQGGAGVGLFFVLSGFVLVYNYGARFATGAAGYGRFLRARLARVYPFHVICLVLVTVVFALQRNPAVTHPGGSSVVGWLANLVLVHAWVPSLSFHSWNGPSWSISDELFFYAVFPVLCWRVLGRVRRAALPWIAAGLYVVDAVLFFGVSLLVARHEVAAGNAAGAPFLLSRVAYLPWLRVWEFGLGCVLGTMLAGPSGAGTSPTGPFGSRTVREVATVVVALAAVGIQFVPDCLQRRCGPSVGTAAALLDVKLYVIYVPLAAVLVAALAWGPTWLSGVLSRPWPVRLGEASYAFYLLQWTTRAVLDHAAPVGAVLTWAAVLATWVAALLAHRFVEAPLRRLVQPR